jgi:dTDP-4-amino-4,6-dideoxygalactose transaminase
MKAYQGLGFKQGDFPVSETTAAREISLPMFPELSPQQQQRVAVCVLESIRRGATS